MINLNEQQIQELIEKTIKEEVLKAIENTNIRSIIEKSVEQAVENSVESRLDKEFWKDDRLEEVFVNYLGHEFKDWIRNNYWDRSMLGMTQEAIKGKMYSLSFTELKELVDYLSNKEKSYE